MVVFKIKRDIRILNRLYCLITSIIFIAVFPVFSVNAKNRPDTPAQQTRILLVKQKKAYVSIILPENPSETQKFAGSELAKYLQKISGVGFLIHSVSDKSGPGIIIKRNKELGDEEYTITLKNHNIQLAGGSDRAILYAVYDFLHLLGCRWIAPKLSFYDGLAEYIPRKPVLYFNYFNKIQERPRFKYRKLDVEEGLTHNVKNLKKIIEWMPKLRFNILMVPLDYGGSGRVKWDKWRKQLTPELKKRDLMIEVGGHGYQNFLNAEMDDGKLFQKHPEWFGRDKNCKPSPAENLVFNTANPGAIHYFFNNIKRYIRHHPEINIFDFWPPDGARWSECSRFADLGTPQDRQTRLANKVDSVLKRIRPGIRLEMIAYAKALDPPEKVALNKDILVDFCPINQSFEKQIYSTEITNNAKYVKAIYEWRKRFRGDIGLYSYYRKYAWRSLPNIIPHYMQKDLKWYAHVPLQGISTYAEPGDWYTYELNYYVLGHLAWNPDCNVDSLINQFCRVRYGSVWEKAKSVYLTLENVVRIDGSIPYTKLKTRREIQEAETRLTSKENEIHDLIKKTLSAGVTANLSRLMLMIKYANYDLKIQKARTVSSPFVIRNKVKKLVDFLENNRNKGVFILSHKNILPGFLRHYGIMNG